PLAEFFPLRRSAARSIKFNKWIFLFSKK
uniref:Uncharacterized protein n=1 Tax=Macaca fascicularis TaxID=9541 RepID=A0A7N9CD30_MACFA